MCQERIYHLRRFARIGRTDRIDERTAGMNVTGRRFEQRSLGRGKSFAVGGLLLPARLGMASNDADSRAGRVDQDAIETPIRRKYRRRGVAGNDRRQPFPPVPAARSGSRLCARRVRCRAARLDRPCVRRSAAFCCRARCRHRGPLLPAAARARRRASPNFRTAATTRRHRHPRSCVRARRAKLRPTIGLRRVSTPCSINAACASSGVRRNALTTMALCAGSLTAAQISSSCVAERAPPLAHDPGR